MEKIVIDVLHEIHIKSSIDEKTFTAEFSIHTDELNYNIPLKCIGNNKFTLKIPKYLQNISEKQIKYSVFVYFDNARFEIDSGDLKLITEMDFTMDKISSPNPNQLSLNDDSITETIIEHGSVNDSIPTLSIDTSHIIEDITLPPVEQQIKLPNKLGIFKQFTDSSSKHHKINDEIKELLTNLKSRK